MKSRTSLILLLALVLTGALLLFLCQERTTRDVLRISIPSNTTHMAVGQTSRLLAYEEYQDGSMGAASAASAQEASRQLINARWSVSDPQVASIDEEGVLKALSPGRVTVQTYWEGFAASTTVEVLKELPAGVLPQITARESRCVPQGVSLSLNGERALGFQLSFADGGCHDLTLEAVAPDQQLPWSFDFRGAHLELSSAAGPIVSGLVSLPEGGQIAFTAWSEGTGAYPVSLKGKTVLLLGDSMAEGIGWTLKPKIESAGGRLIVIPWYSSTTVGWGGEGRFKEELARYNPDVIFIALGSNEIFVSRPEASAPLIKRMVAEIGDRPAYWIGPPSWKPDHGIVRVIEDNFIPKRFYNSNDLRVPRRKDGAHPTVEGYATWTDLIWNWYARAG